MEGTASDHSSAILKPCAPSPTSTLRTGTPGRRSMLGHRPRCFGAAAAAGHRPFAAGAVRRVPEGSRPLLWPRAAVNNTVGLGCTSLPMRQTAAVGSCSLDTRPAVGVGRHTSCCWSEKARKGVFIQRCQFGRMSRIGQRNPSYGNSTFEKSFPTLC